MRKKQEMKVTYHYIEPKNEEEKQEQQRKIDDIFALLFEATVEDMGKKGKPIPRWLES